MQKIFILFVFGGLLLLCVSAQVFSISHRVNLVNVVDNYYPQ